MALLRRMSEIGLRMAERLDRQSELAAVQSEGPIPDRLEPVLAGRLHEAARAFAQVSRAVTVCVALEDRIERGPPLEAASLAAGAVRPVPHDSRLGARRREVETRVRDTIERACAADPARIEGLVDRLFDFVDREIAAVDRFLARPVDEIVADLCRRLGVEPCSPEASSPYDARLVSDGPLRGPYVSANDLTFAAKNAAAEAAAGAVPPEREDAAPDAGRISAPPSAEWRKPTRMTEAVPAAMNRPPRTFAPPRPPPP